MRDKAARQMVHVYLTPDEKKRVAKAANTLGISTSAYIKIKLFGSGDSKI